MQELHRHFLPVMQRLAVTDRCNSIQHSIANRHAILLDNVIVMLLTYG